MNRNALIHELQIIRCIRKLRNRKNPAVFLAFVAFIATLSVAYSLPTSSLVIGNTGKISLTGVTAKSGSPADIQTAVNAIVSAGGGTVYIPAGNFTFNPPVNGIGVTIPYTNVPINIIGAGIGLTVLQETQNSGAMFKRSWNGESYSGAAIRISGISFVGYVVNETVSGNTAIDIRCTQDFRIDHCSFQDFAGAAIQTYDDTGGTYALIDRGVIDHCSFDNPYKDACQPHNATGSYWSVWGYGIIIINNYYTWDPNIADYLGKYYNATQYPYTYPNSGAHFPLPQPIYIENCNFSRTRHAIASNGAGYYVSRYNYFEKCSPYGQNDVHGGAPWGGRGLESYGNIFNFTDESYSLGQDAAIEPRGGGGVVWNNTVILNPSYGSMTVQFGNDGEVAPYDVENFYIWNNTAVYTNGDSVDFNSKIRNTVGYVVNVNYFLRAPSQTLDGFTYTPYTYPHPLTFQTIP